MRNLLFLVWILQSIFIWGQETDLEKLSLNGKVKCTKTTLYSGIEKGNKLRKGKEISYVEHFFSSEGNSLQKFIYVDKKPNVKQEFIYNDKGILIEKKYYFLEILIESIEYKYDQKGNEIEAIAFDTQRRKKSIFTTQYNEQNKKISQQRYDGNMKFLQKTDYFYDAQFHLVKEILYNEKGKIEAETRLRRDKNGNIFEYLLDWKDVKKGQDKFIYKLDKNGNWIEKLEYKNGKIYTIAEREIEYF